MKPMRGWKGDNDLYMYAWMLASQGESPTQHFQTLLQRRGQETEK
jgi:hypothetical protein